MANRHWLHEQDAVSTAVSDMVSSSYVVLIFGLDGLRNETHGQTAQCFCCDSNNSWRRPAIWHKLQARRN